MGRVLSIREFLQALNSDVALLNQYVSDPTGTMNAAGLTAEEQKVLFSGDDRLIYQAMARCAVNAPANRQAPAVRS
jgi:hypothetical protein